MQYELPPHPEHTMQWSPREQRVIVNHVNQAIEPMQKRIVELEAQNTQLTASLETASSAVIVLKQKQREGWAQIASGQELLSASEVEQILARWSYEIHGDRARYIVRETEAAHNIKEKP